MVIAVGAGGGWAAGEGAGGGALDALEAALEAQRGALSALSASLEAQQAALASLREEQGGGRPVTACSVRGELGAVDVARPGRRRLRAPAARARATRPCLVGRFPSAHGSDPRAGGCGPRCGAAAGG